jgi:hypothetical protein
MNRQRWGRIAGIAIGMVMIIVLKACARPAIPIRPMIAPGPVVDGVVGISHFVREARDGGFVTVYAGVLPGPLPDTNMTGPPITVAWFTNVGEGGKHEKRYDWKPNSEAQYELVLSNGSPGRTRWTMNEINLATKGRTAVRSGRLWACEDYHPSPSREVGFKDCRPGIRYERSESGLNPMGNHVASFASYLKGLEAEADEANGPVWISCTSGCCTLGAALGAAN